MDGVCECCGARGRVTVCASTMGAMSYAYCDECLNGGVEPYDAMVQYISCAGHYPDEISGEYVEIVKNSLRHLGISEERFAHDVECMFDFVDAAGGYHSGGCGVDPTGYVCGECSTGDCTQCAVWERKESLRSN